MAKIDTVLKRDPKIVKRQAMIKRLKDMKTGDTPKELREDLNDLISLLVEKNVI